MRAAHRREGEAGQQLSGQGRRVKAVVEGEHTVVNLLQRDDAVGRQALLSVLV